MASRLENMKLRCRQAVGSVFFVYSECEFELLGAQIMQRNGMIFAQSCICLLRDAFSFVPRLRFMRATIPFAAAKPLRRRGRRSGRGRAARSIPTVDAAFPSVLPGGNAESEAACRKVSGLCASVG